MPEPMEQLLDTVDWKEISPPHISIANDPGALYATHEGTLNLGGLDLRCYVLNDGRRVFDADVFRKVPDA